MNLIQLPTDTIVTAHTNRICAFFPVIYSSTARKSTDRIADRQHTKVNNNTCNIYIIYISTGFYYRYNTRCIMLELSSLFALNICEISDNHHLSAHLIVPRLRALSKSLTHYLHFTYSACRR